MSRTRTSDSTVTVTVGDLLTMLGSDPSPDRLRWAVLDSHGGIWWPAMVLGKDVYHKLSSNVLPLKQWERLEAADGELKKSLPNCTIAGRPRRRVFLLFLLQATFEPAALSPRCR